MISEGTINHQRALIDIEQRTFARLPDAFELVRTEMAIVGVLELPSGKNWPLEWHDIPSGAAYSMNVDIDWPAGDSMRTCGRSGRWF